MKFQTIDESYLARRKEFSNRTGHRELWSVIDHFPLYVGIGTLSRFLAIADLLRRTIDVPGHIAEFGSWRGANLMFMTKLLRIYDPHGCKQVHCFESFAGLETFSQQDGDAGESETGTYRGSYDELLAMMALNDLGDDIIIHKGDILQTLPSALSNQSLGFSFIYCDTDLYAPTRLILDSIHPRLSKGGMFVMDEWNYDKWPGESTAVREFMECNGTSYEMLHVQNARQPSLVLKKTA